MHAAPVVSPSSGLFHPHTASASREKTTATVSRVLTERLPPIGQWTVSLGKGLTVG